MTIDNDVIVRDHCHTAGKYRGSAHGDCNINLKSNHKIHVVFNNLKNYDSHFVIQELGKFNLFNLSYSLDSFVKNSKKDNFKYLSQEFDNNILDLVKQKGFYSYEYMSDFEQFKEELRSKENFHSLLTDRRSSNKGYEHALNV